MAAHLPRAAADWAANQSVSSVVRCVDVAGMWGGTNHALCERTVSMPPSTGIEDMAGALGPDAQERGGLAELIAGQLPREGCQRARRHWRPRQ